MDTRVGLDQHPFLVLRDSISSNRKIVLTVEKMNANLHSNALMQTVIKFLYTHIVLYGVCVVVVFIVSKLSKTTLVCRSIKSLIEGNGG